jgi:catechol 2,3-dioxygenase-like lactoylglutathione lyase family enzyme
VNILATTLTFTVPEPAASAGFLADHFGYRPVLAFDGGAALEHPAGGPVLFFLRVGLSTISPSQRHVTAQGVILALTVSDIEAAVSELQDKGVEPLAGIAQDEWGERHVQFSDRNGLTVQLVEWVGERPY